jgi:hypothetical protein
MNKSICKTDKSGNKRWYLDGKLHREDGPAIDYANGDKVWCLNGQLHREDGPAVKYADSYKAWYYQDKCLDCQNNEEFFRLLKLKVFW